ncbi:DUF262 domain-containing protein [Microlunatus soli]|uniref:GmrSD restriction endonucleases N-terminal domain-containing protein n=1 Tax=Microlunatus soli TaxID=630515 RepID=A0A1H2A9E3_9ACTN|nr:DUF262 domain-containing protein [Microlunatus soli]SDT42610.1 Protein of unknown function DUF262 [Microlunatus soli]
MATERRQTTQAVAWFWDLFNRDLLELDPPYQRRSVWSQTYKDYFIDTVLLDYPAPAVFLFEDIDDAGVAKYFVVDGKQRLSTVFEFLDGRFPVSDDATMDRYRGLMFADLPSETRQRFYRYQFSIEFLPTIDESALSNIFDRINRNVARLTAQELRHARFGGVFASRVESLTEHLEEVMPKDFPRIAAGSRRQMKDAELVAQLLLLVERGIESYSQDDLDDAYNARDEEWEQAPDVEDEAREVIRTLASWADEILGGPSRRLRNQADFYSLFGAILSLRREDRLPDQGAALRRLGKAMSRVNSEDDRQRFPDAKRYYEAARSASNDIAQRRARVKYLEDVITGDAESVRS